MYCPLCKTELKFSKASNKEEDGSEYAHCIKCDIHYLFHHPYRGLHSKATDNWSLTYIK